MKQIKFASLSAKELEKRKEDMTDTVHLGFSFPLFLHVRVVVVIRHVNVISVLASKVPLFLLLR